MYTAELSFSGEQIARSNTSGRYEVRLLAGNVSGWTQSTWATPTFAVSQFGESPLSILAVADTAVGTHHDRLLDSVRVTISLEVHTPGRYVIAAVIGARQRTLAQMSVTADLSPGMPQTVVMIPARRLRHSGVDGPYSLAVTIADARGRQVANRVVPTRAYRASSFSP